MHFCDYVHYFKSLLSETYTQRMTQSKKSDFMQIKEMAKEGLKREFNVVVPAKTIEAQTEVKLKEVGKTAKVAGFRPGHVPVKLLRQRYGRSVMGEVLEQAVHDAQHKVIDEKKLRPALQPQIKIVNFD